MEKLTIKLLKEKCINDFIIKERYIRDEVIVKLSDRYFKEKHKELYLLCRGLHLIPLAMVQLAFDEDKYNDMTNREKNEHQIRAVIKDLRLSDYEIATRLSSKYLRKLSIDISDLDLYYLLRDNYPNIPVDTYGGFIANIDNPPMELISDLLKKYVSSDWFHKLGYTRSHVVNSLTIRSSLSKYCPMILRLLNKSDVPTFYHLIHTFSDTANPAKIKKPKGFWDDKRNFDIILHLMCDIENKPLNVIPSYVVSKYIPLKKINKYYNSVRDMRNKNKIKPTEGGINYANIKLFTIYISTK